jgi:hypothetical protein
VRAENFTVQCHPLPSNKTARPGLQLLARMHQRIPDLRTPDSKSQLPRVVLGFVGSWGLEGRRSSIRRHSTSPPLGSRPTESAGLERTRVLFRTSKRHSRDSGRYPRTSHPRHHPVPRRSTSRTRTPPRSAGGSCAISSSGSLKSEGRNVHARVQRN